MNLRLSLAMLACLLLCLVFACSRGTSAQTTQATLRFTGLLAADGCGYFLDIDGKEYKPINEEAIPEGLQEQDSVAVELTYELVSPPQDYSCGMLPSHYEANLKIVEIRARQ